MSGLEEAEVNKNRDLLSRDVESSPPTYDGVVNNPPPSYETIFGKIKEAKDKSEGNPQFAERACNIIAGSIGFTIVLGVMLALPIAMIVVGALNLEKCPMEYLIPIWLIVSGCLSAAQQLVSIFKKMCEGRCDDDEDEEDGNDGDPSLVNRCNSLIGLFNFAWFVAGSIWVYRKYAPSNTSDPSLDTYCDYSTYYFAFWVITITYVFVGLCILSCCCCCCCLAGAASKK